MWHHWCPNALSAARDTPKDVFSRCVYQGMEENYSSTIFRIVKMHGERRGGMCMLYSKNMVKHHRF